MPNTKQSILLTGARAPITLEMARSFAKQGHKVIVCDSSRLTIARWSNTVTKYYTIPAPKNNIKAFIEALQKIIYQEKIDHLIPTCEETIYIAQEKDKFNCKVWTCDGDLILKLHNKLTFSSFNLDGLPTPKTEILNQFTDWMNSKNYVFKAIYSRFATSVIINQEVNKTTIPEGEQVKWIAQQKINGQEICIYSIWDEGKLKGYKAYLPLYKAGKGAGVFFEPVDNQEVYELVARFGEKINYTGQLCFDVIIEESSNIPYFIECNPRGTSGAHLLNNQLANCYLEKEYTTPFSNQAYKINYAMILLHPLVLFNRNVRKAKDVVFKWNDPLPSLLQILSLLEITYKKISQKCTWLEATTGDIEWNGDEN